MKLAQLATAWRRAAPWLGLALFVAAAWGALAQVSVRDMADQVLAQPWLAGLMAGCVIANLLLGGVTFWLLTRGYPATPPVSLLRMTQLVAAAALFNYLPLRPGLVGRTAYLKLRHALAIRDSIVILAIATVASLIVLALVAGLILLAPDGWLLIAGALALAVLSAATGPLLRVAIHRRIPAAWALLPTRAADLLLNALRLWAALLLLGHRVSYEQALLAGIASIAVTVTGITPNGLGLREWMLGGLMAHLEPGLGPAAIAAAAIDRAIETIVVLVAGGMSLRKVGLEPHPDHASPGEAPGSGDQST